MKARNMVAGMVVIAFIAGGYLSGLFPKFGGGLGGSGSGDGPGVKGREAMKDAGPREAPVAVSTIEDQPADDAPQIVGGMSDDPRVLDVRVDSREYQVVEHKQNSQTYRPAELSAVVELAKKKEGNEQGIKVRIHRLSSSRASAEESLKQALVDAGISQDAIAWEPIE